MTACFFAYEHKVVITFRIGNLDKIIVRRNTARKYRNSRNQRINEFLVNIVEISMNDQRFYKMGEITEYVESWCVCACACALMQEGEKQP